MEAVKQFEDAIAEFYGAPYAVATDSCTHAIELCLRHTFANSVSCPKHTYLSIPMTFEKLGMNWEFHNHPWEHYYYISNTNIIDAAVLWEQNSYRAGRFMCLSFQYKKHLSLGRGGMILTDDRESAIALKKMSYDGRQPDMPWADQNIDTYGYHYYMTPETAQLGLDKLDVAINTKPPIKSSLDYPDLSLMKVFEHVK